MRLNVDIDTFVYIIIFRRVSLYLCQRLMYIVSSDLSLCAYSFCPPSLYGILFTRHLS